MNNIQSCLDKFNNFVKEWFIESIGQPSLPQKMGWPEIVAGKNVLLCAPTGSGKTLAAFLKCIDLIFSEKKVDSINDGIRIVYVSPLKALNNDIYRNLEIPINGIKERARQQGIRLADINIAIRTGDTQQKDRKHMIKNPPDILITTPESLFIMLTTNSTSELFKSTEYLIIDEIHSIYWNKRGVHFSISAERLQQISTKQIKRIGLSATVNPLEEVACFLGGYDRNYDSSGKVLFSKRKVSILNCDTEKKINLSVNVTVKDFRELPGSTIWNTIYSQLLSLVNKNKSTLIFVNNRKLAELVASGINKLAGNNIARTHHGSMSRELRQDLEQQLKDGKVPCLVATSTLEMGIDIGSIDLVLQVGSPDSSAQILQRIGRSGHKLGAKSKGIIIPKTRMDLLNSAFISSEAMKYEIESLKTPENCMDVLAQQIVSISCVCETDIEEIYHMIKQSYAYRNLPFELFKSVINMLSYPSPEDEPDSIKPRIHINNINGRIYGNKLGRMMCLLGGGTIIDKGNYKVYLKETNMFLGELQEEFVFESRVGDRFLLGSTVWRVEAVERDRVIVSQSNGAGAKVPFWIGDKTMRSYESGLNFGRFLGNLEEMVDDENYYQWAQDSCKLDYNAANNLRDYAKGQIQATGYLHNDKRIVCEYFSDEAGSRRIIVHTPFGGKVHVALGIILQFKLINLLNCDVEYISNNEGILLHIIGYAGELSNILSLVEKNEIEDVIVHNLPSTPIFNMCLRYNLTRSLLISNGCAYGKRNPLWIQRLRSAEVAQSVIKIENHPIIIETYRECMHDIMDISNLNLIINKIDNQEIKVVNVVNERPSPFSSELIFNFWQIYQYIQDLPIAEKRNQLLLSSKDIIKLASGIDGEYDLLDQKAIEFVRKELIDLKYSKKIRNSNELYYYIYTLGELKANLYHTFEIKGLKENDSCEFLKTLEDEGRILRIKINATEDKYWIASEDYISYCKMLDIDPLKHCLEVGLPGEERLIPASEWLDSQVLSVDLSERDSIVRILRRYTRFIGPFTISDIIDRYRVNNKKALDAISFLVCSHDLVILRNSNHCEKIIYCNTKVFEKIKKKTIEFARKDIKPKSNADYISFLIDYHGIGEKIMSAQDKLLKVINKLQGLFLPVEWWEDFIFPVRVKKYKPELLDNLCLMGIVKWVGRVNKNRNEVTFYCNDNFSCKNLMSIDFEFDEVEKKAYGVLKEKGACFLQDFAKQLGLSSHQLLKKIERLVWMGLIRNDSFSVLRYYIDIEKKNSLWGKHNSYPNMGRWEIVGEETYAITSAGVSDFAICLLDRYGVISKDIVNFDNGNYNWSEVYDYLSKNELITGIKRGFYLEGFSGIQFARDAEINMLRLYDINNTCDKYTTACSCDPLLLNLNKFVTKEKLIKNMGTAIVLENGNPVLVVKGYGRIMCPIDNDINIIKEAIVNFIDTYRYKSIWGSKKYIYTEYWENNNTPIEKSPIYDFLLDKGYDKGYKGITFWP